MNGYWKLASLVTLGLAGFAGTAQAAPAAQPEDTASVGRITSIAPRISAGVLDDALNSYISESGEWEVAGNSSSNSSSNRNSNSDGRGRRGRGGRGCDD